MANINDRIEKLINRTGLRGMNKYSIKALMYSGLSIKEALETVKSYANINTGSDKKNIHATLACPRCNNTMRVVTIANDRKVKYCIYDRISLPLPISKKE